MAVDAQSYGQAIGVRGGLVNGITYKKFISGGSALEFVVDPFVNGIELSVIYEIQKSNAFGAPNLDWYYGAGASLGFYNGHRHGYHHKHDHDHGSHSGAGIGVLGLVGLEYVFQEIPLALSLDVGPAINIAPYGYVYTAAGLGLKYYW